jgi:hypothetical protein
MIKDKNSYKSKKLSDKNATSSGSNSGSSANASAKSKRNKGDSTDIDKRKMYLELIAKFCDKCGTPYSSDNLKVVKDSEFSSIIHFTCANCKSNHIASFFKPMGVSSRTPVNTDITAKEIGKFAEKGKVTSEEILDLYNALITEE